MSTSKLAIALLLTASTSAASQAISKFAVSSGKELDKINERASKNISAGASSIAKGLAIAAPIEMAVKAAAGLEDKIADVAKVTNTDFGSKQFHGLELSAMRVGEYLGRTSDEVGSLMAELASGGTQKNKLESVATTAGKIGVAFDVSAGEAGKAYMMIKNAMNATEKDTLHTLDAMNAATNKYGGKASELLNFMAQGGASVARTLKIGGGDMQAFGNSMQLVGITSSEAATSMQRFQKAVLNNKTLSATFNKAGGGTAGVVAILENARKSGNAYKYLNAHGVGEYSNQMAQVANNMNAGNGLKAQLKYLGNDKNVNGSADQEFKNRQKTTVEQFNKMKVSVANIAIKLGQTLIPAVNQLMVQLKPLITQVTNWISKNPQLVTQIMKGALAFAAMKVATGGLRIGIGNLIKTGGKIKWFMGLFDPKTKQGYEAGFKKMLAIEKFEKFKTVLSSVPSKLKSVGSAAKSMGNAIMGAGRFLMANPIVLIITAIAVAAFLIIKYWKPIKEFFIKLWDKVKSLFKTTVKFIAAILINFTPIGLIYKNWGKISEWFKRIWGKVKSAFSWAVNVIKGYLLNFTPIGLIFKYWDPISETFGKIWDAVKDKFNKFIEWIENTWVGKLVKLVTKIPKFFTNLWNTAKNNDLTTTVNYVNKTANNNGLTTTLDPAPKLPQLLPARPNNVVTNQYTSPITINAPGGNPYEIKKQVVNALKEHQAQQQRKGFAY